MYQTVTNVSRVLVSYKPILAINHTIFFPSIYFAYKSIARTSLSKSKTLDSEAARLDGNKLAKRDFNLEFYEGFI